jgi:hypothetical protein
MRTTRQIQKRNYLYTHQRIVYNHLVLWYKLSDISGITKTPPLLPERQKHPRYILPVQPQRQVNTCSPAYIKQHGICSRFKDHVDSFRRTFLAYHGIQQCLSTFIRPREGQ